MIKYENFVVEASKLAMRMQLITEGAIYFYEGKAMPLYWFARNNNMEEAAFAFDLVGAALVELRDLISIMQKEQEKANSNDG